MDAKLVKAPGAAAFTPGKASAHASVEWTIKVGGETAIQVELDDINAAGSVSSSNGKIFGNIPTAKIGTVGANFQTTLGLTAAQFATNLQGVVDKYIGVLNTNLTAGVVIPSILGIQVVDAEITFFDGYLELGADVTQTTFENLRDFMNAWAYEIQEIKALGQGFEKLAEYIEENEKFLQN